MTIFGLRERTLKHLAYRYWRKNTNRTGDENWRLAEKLLVKLEKRYGADIYQDKEDKPSLFKRILNKIRNFPHGE